MGVVKKKIAMSVYMCRYLPVIAAFAMLIHVALLTFAASGAWAENFVMICFACMLFANDIAYGFCWVHRALGCYAVAIDWCCNFQRYVGFGWFLPYAHGIALAVGIVLFYFLIKKKCKN